MHTFELKFIHLHIMTLGGGCEEGLKRWNVKKI